MSVAVWQCKSGFKDLRFKNLKILREKKQEEGERIRIEGTKDSRFKDLVERK